MSAALPTDIRDRIRQKIWAKADELDWPRISDLERTAWYENWTKDKDVGGVLSHFMDARKVRVYIKDSLLKPYLRSRLQDDWGRVLLTINMEAREALVKKSYDKPHGRQLLDGKVICWGNSREWKSILISVFERAYQLESGHPHAAVLVETGKTTNAGTREMILDASQKLGLRHLAWIDCPREFNRCGNCTMMARMIGAKASVFIGAQSTKHRSLSHRRSFWTSLSPKISHKAPPALDG